MFKIGCREIGERNTRRWIIHNDQVPEHYWTGNGWDATQGEAKLYHDRNKAYPAAKKLQDAILKHLPVRKYKATIEIEVRSDKPLSLQEIRDYCYGAASFELDYDLYGTGPINESQVWSTIQWSSLRKV
jgi:hypothetical protein